MHTPSIQEHKRRIQSRHATQRSSHIRGCSNKRGLFSHKGVVLTDGGCSHKMGFVQATDHAMYWILNEAITSTYQIYWFFSFSLPKQTWSNLTAVGRPSAAWEDGGASNGRSIGPIDATSWLLFQPDFPFRRKGTKETVQTHRTREHNGWKTRHHWPRPMIQRPAIIKLKVHSQ